MDFELLQEIEQLNPWLNDQGAPIIEEPYVPRIQGSELLDPEWDKLWTILIGPRRAGKTTLGKALSHQLIEEGRYKQFLYLNCDYLSIRSWLSRPLFISQAMETLALKKPIVMIDEVQRLESPGVLLKAVIDLNLPIKHIATGSSQLELRSKVQEFLTGRQFSSLVLPMSLAEWDLNKQLEEVLVYGAYPQVLQSNKKQVQIQEIYSRYIQKDIVEILKVGQPDVLQRLLTLVAHGSGQLVNLQQLAADCGVSTTMIRNHLDILEKTYVLAKLTPFVGNKRTEVTSNPVYYFVDNGFRNAALRNFLPIASRADRGLLVEGFVFQELLKLRAQHYLDFDIHYWRTKSGAEVDFVLYQSDDRLIPVEVKAQRMAKPTISRGYRSFLEAYKPKTAFLITENLLDRLEIGETSLHCIPLGYLSKALDPILKTMSLS